MRIVIYARLSQEDASAPDAGRTATERQVADCRARASAEGWEVVDVYEDPDHGASDLRRRRPAFEQMLTDLGDGVVVDAVLCYKLDRLLRHPKESERILDLADARGLAIISLNDPGIDLRTPTGRAMFRMTIVWAKLETETMSLRIRRKAREVAESGRPNGGGIRPFGLRYVPSTATTPYHYVLVPAEAELVREAADRLLTGASLHSIVADWNARGIRTPGRQAAPEGRNWEVSSLKRMLIAPRLVGDREHRGRVVSAGAFPPLLERSTWERLCAILSAPRGSAPRSARSYLLTGLTYCGRCGTKLQAHQDARRVRRYACAQPRGCGGIVVAAGNLEPLIAEAIAQRLDSPAFAEAVQAQQSAGPAVQDDLAALRADQASLEEAASAYFVYRTLSRPEYVRVRDQLERRIEAARRALTRTASDAARVAVLDVRGEWNERPIAWQHDVARALIERITVNPAPRRGTRFDPSRIDVEWLA